MTPRPPADAVVALRSLPRRFKAVFAGQEDDESPEDLANRPGSDGKSALDHVADATAVLGGSPAAGGIEAGVGALSDAAEALADRSSHVNADDWAREVTVDGQTMTALDELWHKVDAAIASLKAAERTIDEVRGR